MDARRRIRYVKNDLVNIYTIKLCLVLRKFILYTIYLLNEGKGRSAGSTVHFLHKIIHLFASCVDVMTLT